MSSDMTGTCKDLKGKSLWKLWMHPCVYKDDSFYVNLSINIKYTYVRQLKTYTTLSQVFSDVILPVSLHNSHTPSFQWLYDRRTRGLLLNSITHILEECQLLWRRPENTVTQYLFSWWSEIRVVILDQLYYKCLGLVRRTSWPEIIVVTDHVVYQVFNSTSVVSLQICQGIVTCLNVSLSFEGRTIGVWPTRKHIIDQTTHCKYINCTSLTNTGKNGE